MIIGNISSSELFFRPKNGLVMRKNILKKNLLLFDHYFKTVHSYTLSMSHINNQNNTNIKITANIVIMRIINNAT